MKKKQKKQAWFLHTDDLKSDVPDFIMMNNPPTQSLTGGKPTTLAFTCKRMQMTEQQRNGRHRNYTSVIIPRVDKAGGRFLGGTEMHIAHMALDKEEEEEDKEEEEME